MFLLLVQPAAFRYENDVPILIPGINDEHADLLKKQQEERQWNGFIAPMPNCTTTGLAITLKPLIDKLWSEKCFYDLNASIVRGR